MPMDTTETVANKAQGNLNAPVTAYRNCSAALLPNVLLWRDEGSGMPCDVAS